MNETLKLLAKRARERLKTAGEISQKPQKQAYLSAGTTYMVVANMKQIEDDPMFAKVKKVLEREKEEIILNPIAYVIDKKLISTLSRQEREKYILKTTKRFNEIKRYIIKNNLLA
ncbi:MAG: hypothetical protein IJ542_03820 [Clostridia bacterium]|nr:hypothetical protein [Clostridia bacterium]